MASKTIITTLYVYTEPINKIVYTLDYNIVDMEEHYGVTDENDWIMSIKFPKTYKRNDMLKDLEQYIYETVPYKISKIRCVHHIDIE